MGAALPPLRAHFQLSATSGGSLVSAYNIGALVATVVCGSSERKTRPRTAITGLLALYALGCLGAGVAPSWTFFVLCAIIIGFGYGGLVLYLNTAFAQGFGARNVLMLNLLNAVFGFGAILGPLLVGLLARVDVRLVLFGAAVLAVPCWLARGCGQLISPATTQPAADEQPAGRGPFSAAAVRLVLPFTLVGFLYAGLETATGGWESTHLTWTGWSMAAAAQLTSLYWAGLTVGRVFISILAARVAPATIIRAGLAVAAVALVLAVVPHVGAVAYCLAGLALAPVLPTLLAWMATVVPSAQSANAVVLTACMAANAGYPSLVGVVADQHSPARIPLLLAGFALAGLLAAVVLARLRQHTASEPGLVEVGVPAEN
jgi:MFS transporter, FHS family, glucose/mannose:H+ symporter